jgi:glycosyltransferase involved in cell wall biosynthesis
VKVLIIGHACGPGLGSEPGLTWNWAAHLSAYHDVWVIAHPKFRRATEEELQKHQYPGLRVCWVSVPKVIDPWRSTDGDHNIRLHYLIWQRLALREAMRLHSHCSFDLVHYVSWNSVSAPPPLSRLPVPFAWGPIGGAQTANPAFREYFGPGWNRERLRTFRVRCLKFLPALRRTARASSLVIAANRETHALLRMVGAPRVHIYLDVGIESKWLTPEPPKRPQRNTFVLHWSGRLEYLKALPLALQAMTHVRDLPVRLLVSGDGPLRSDAEELTRDLGLGQAVTFTGFVPRPRLMQLFQESDAFIFTSLRDTFGAVALEAMSQGLPVIALDHQGVGTHLPSDAAIKAPVTSPAETVAKLAAGIRILATQPEVCRRMGEAAWAYARTQSWEHRAQQMSTWYFEILHGKSLGDRGAGSA